MQLLCDTFVFKIIPMLNPDGVIVGNYRCSLTGRDLNRAYRVALRDSFPSISHAKSMIKKSVPLILLIRSLITVKMSSSIVNASMSRTARCTFTAILESF